MKNKYGLCSGALTLMLLAAFLVGIIDGPCVSANSKVDRTLEFMWEESEEQRCKVDIWLTDIDLGSLDKDVKKQVEQMGGELEKDSLEYVTFNVSVKRKLYEERQIAKNEEFLKRMSLLIGNLEERITFVSHYTPVICAVISREEAEIIAAEKDVRAIIYSPDLCAESEMDVSVPTVRANYTRDTLQLKGGGMKIGILEADGFPSKDSTYFNTSNIVYEPGLSVRTAAHATKVAYIMCGKAVTSGGKTYEGIVPNAKIYATYIRGVSGDWRNRVEWLLGEGVLVINMSLGWGSNLGAYHPYEVWLDHVAINQSVHVVKSAGNRGESDKYITVPGMAYNIVTVGGINDSNTADSAGADDSLAPCSSYKEAAEMPNKPDIVAPAQGITFADIGTGGGTSYAAPHVSAIITQICQENPLLIQKQACVKAILAASIAHTKNFQTSDIDNMNVYGAGVADARASLYTTSNGRFVASNFPTGTSYNASASYTFNVSAADDQIRVALSWLANVSFEGVNPLTTFTPTVQGGLADLKLVVKDPYGNIVGWADDDYNNTEIVKFFPNGVTGTYTIEISVVEPAFDENGNRTIIYYGIAWW